MSHTTLISKKILSYDYLFLGKKLAYGHSLFLRANKLIKIAKVLRANFVKIVSCVPKRNHEETGNWTNVQKNRPSLVLTIKAQTTGPQEPSVRISLSKDHEGSVNGTTCAWFIPGTKVFCLYSYVVNYRSS